MPFPSPSRITGKERDAETGLDYFGARYNASTVGRFTSPDPVAGEIANPQSLNLYSYVRNNPLKFIDPTGMTVEWHDSPKVCNKDKSDCRTRAQRSYEDRLKQMRESKDKKTREKGERLMGDYERLQQSKAVFEVKNEGGSGSSHGEMHYDGNDHFTINLAGDTRYSFSDNQRVAHEFEHGRQVLDGELSFRDTATGWMPFAHDLYDEAKGFQAGFDIEAASPGQGSIVNGISQALRGGLSNATQYLNDHTTYRGMANVQLNVGPNPPPTVYVVPR